MEVSHHPWRVIHRLGGCKQSSEHEPPGMVAARTGQAACKKSFHRRCICSSPDRLTWVGSIPTDPGGPATGRSFQDPSQASALLLAVWCAGRRGQEQGRMTLFSQPSQLPAESPLLLRINYPIPLLTDFAALKISLT